MDEKVQNENFCIVFVCKTTALNMYIRVAPTVKKYDEF